MTTADSETQVEYDREADVLYLCFGAPREAVCLEPVEGLVLRLDPATDELTGITMIGPAEKWLPFAAAR